MKNLKINAKVALDLEAINNSEYASQIFGNETRDTFIITDILDFHKTFTCKPTAKSRVEIVLPMRFIKGIA